MPSDTGGSGKSERLEQSSRPTAELIFERVQEDARDELEREPRDLSLSALLAGFTIGATPLVYALTLANVHGDGRYLIAALLYPVGFIAVILGRSQLFTENTLYPVMVAIGDRSAIRPTARLWGIVYTFNLVGCALFALLAVKTDALPDPAAHELRLLGAKAADYGFGRTFFGAIVAGWLLALVAWLVEAAETAIGQFFAIWIVTLLIALGDFSHCVATTVEVSAALFGGAAGLGESFGWLGLATLGNVVGGVLIVTVLNYGQVRASE